MKPLPFSKKSRTYENNNDDDDKNNNRNNNNNNIQQKNLNQCSKPAKIHWLNQMIGYLCRAEWQDVI